MTLNPPIPYLTLSLYDFGATIRKISQTGQVSEYPVDPAAVATTFDWKPKWTTGVIPPDIVYVAVEGPTTVVAHYRPPQMAGLYIDESETPIRIPLPGLVMLRKADSLNDENLLYHAFAVKERPTKKEAQMYVAPLTHVYQYGNICWGSVKYRDTYNPLDPYDFTKAWEALLGSRFGHHTASNASVKYKGEIRKMWIEMEAAGVKEYPLDDMMLAGKTLDIAIKELR